MPESHDYIRSPRSGQGPQPRRLGIVGRCENFHLVRGRDREPPISEPVELLAGRRVGVRIEATMLMFFDLDSCELARTDASPADLRQQVTLLLITEFESHSTFKPGDYNLPGWTRCWTRSSPGARRSRR